MGKYDYKYGKTAWLSRGTDCNRLERENKALLAALQAFIDAWDGHLDDLLIAKMKAQVLIKSIKGGE